MTTLSLPEGRFIEGSLPLYSGISLVTLERHGTAALRPEARFDFAAQAAAVPLTVDEFARAALDYPIVFVGPLRHPFAITSLAADRNGFIGKDGQYRAGAYIPAYLRRHPFVLAEDKANGQWVLGVDEASARLAPLDDPAAQPLFEAGEPSAVTRDAVTFCENYEAAIRRTENWVQLLDDLDLFESRQAHHRPPASDDGPGEPVLLLNYVAVNRARLEELDTASLADLRRIGGLEPAYAHLMSEANWERLAILAEDAASPAVATG